MTPRRSAARAFNAVARAAASPLAEATSAKPAARAAIAVASPTVNTGKRRSELRAAKAATPLALVNASATAPERSMSASATGRTASRGCTIGSSPSARILAAVADAPGSARVTQIVRFLAFRAIALGRRSGEQRVAGFVADLIAEPPPEGPRRRFIAPDVGRRLPAETLRAVRGQRLDHEIESGAIEPGVGAD